MKIRLVLLLFLAGFAASVGAAVKANAYERSIIQIEVTRMQYDYLQPWSKRMGTLQKAGVVIGPDQILTSADFLADRTLVRLQKGGRGKWWPGEVIWIDYHANVALLSSTNTTFWQGTTPLKLADPIPTKGAVEIVRWRNGLFESRKAEINRLRVKRGKLTFAEHIQMELDTEMTGIGWAEAVIAGNKIYGITTSQDGNTCTVLPAPFIRSVLAARSGKNPYRGLGYFDFVWQRTENPATLKFLGLEGEPRGVVVVDVPQKPGRLSELKPKDILLEIDGFALDIQGDYQDPVYGKLSLENLATRNRWAGDEVPIKVWRAGKILSVRYRVPKADFTEQLVPDATYDQEPEYLLLGGLVFQPLNEPFLRIWGADWRRRAPFRLSYYKNEDATRERPALVVLSVIMPDVYNLGYQDFRYLVVEKVNGKKINLLTDIQTALKSPQDGFHILEFTQGDSLRRIVLDAAGAEAATKRILQRYGIAKEHVILPQRTAAAN